MFESIYLKNFKGVSEGNLVFNCKNNPFDNEIQSDMLGIYGQNGSGKTTALEAIKLAVALILGEEIKAEKYAGLISQGSESARMKIVFQFTNPDESIYHVEYAFSISYKDVTVDKAMLNVRNEMAHSDFAAALMAVVAPMPISVLSNAAKKKAEKRLVVEDEVISLSGFFYGTNYRLLVFYDKKYTSSITTYKYGAAP